MQLAPFTKNKFWQKVGIVSLGTIVSHALILVASPVIALLYSPAQFGTYMLYGAFLSFLAILVTFRYEVAISISKAAQEARSLVVLVLLSACTLSAVLAVAISLLDLSAILAMFDAIGLKSVLYFLVAGCLLEGYLRPMRAWNIRSGNMPALAYAKMTQSFTLVSTQVACSMLGHIGLLVGDLISRFAAGSMHLLMAKRRHEWPLESQSLDSITSVAKRYRRFPMYSTWATVCNQFVDSGPLLLLGALFNPAIAGMFAMAHRALMGPLLVFSTSITQVYVAEASQAIREEPERLKKLFWQTSARLAGLGVVPILCLAGMGPTLFAWFFDAGWQQSGQFMVLLAPAALGQFLVGPVYQTLDLLQKQKWTLALNGIGLGGVTLVFYSASHLQWSAASTVGIYSAWVFGYNLCLYLCAAFAVHRHSSQLSPVNTSCSAVAENNPGTPAAA